MTQAMVTCPNGHQNLANQHFCGECGASLAATAGVMYPPNALPTAQVSTAPPDYVPSPYRGPIAASPQRQVPQRRRSRVVVAVLGVVVAVAAAVAIAVGLTKGGGDSGGSAGPSTASMPPSTLDNWEAAVCRPGTLSPGTESTLGGRLLPNADGSMHCFSRNNTTIMIGQYPAAANFALQSDVAMFKGAHYATLPDTGGICVFVAPLPGAASATALEPLTQFGFQINSVPSSG